MSGEAGGSPRIELIDSQEEVAFDLKRISSAAEKAVPLCVEREAEGGVLSSLKEVEVSVVDDGAIAQVHGEFLDDPTPTDVITFDHGEILVGAEVAVRRSVDFGKTPNEELALYIVHGLLHLAGYQDKTEAEFEAMKAAQEEVLAAVW
jgi:probable rRNA maturation factor